MVFVERLAWPLDYQQCTASAEWRSGHGQAPLTRPAESDRTCLALGQRLQRLGACLHFECRFNNRPRWRRRQRREEEMKGKLVRAQGDEVAIARTSKSRRTTRTTHAGNRHTQTRHTAVQLVLYYGPTCSRPPQPPPPLSFALTFRSAG